MTDPAIDTVLYTERLCIAPLQASDTAFLCQQLNDPGFLQHIGDRGVRNETDALNYLERGPWASYRKHGFGLLRVARRDDNEPLGMCGLLQRDWLDEPDIGFAFLQRYCAQGLGREAATAVLHDADTRLQLRRIAAIVSPHNAASIALLEKLGFVYRGPARPPGEEREIALYLRET